ncbi:GDYXXLXY domain-containing protein [Erythrobacter sp. WG]|uniref:GDYXXLXY domain-containing protein n=1 Tax=Erythrobacter sp. WG TaxID=2985510 RepID=UPI00226F264E|nr:GDYXXLXY domain-containing protein [Erythrobacter sp. WG]MCX9147510.1 GDYXXLXY domain-containing protein [Erythrobacter sp. WG]
MNRAARLAAALLPLGGLAVLWGMSAATFARGTEWEVPIAGYDPRDFLRGHYVEFTYDWPGLASEGFPGPQALCLEGAAPRLDRVRTLVEGARCAHPLRADPNGIYGISGLAQGRLYVGQARAGQLDAELRDRDRRGVVTIRQREDGSFAVVDIRLRPLTPAERAARDAPPPSLEPAAPPIMEQ